MSALSITAANVVPGSDARIDRTRYAGAAVTRGQVGYIASDGRWGLADDDSATAAAKIPGGIFLNDAAAGQPVDVQTSGDITIGATMTAGIAYYLGATAGAIVPVADVTTGQTPGIVGMSKSTTVLTLVLKSSGVTL